MFTSKQQFKEQFQQHMNRSAETGTQQAAYKILAAMVRNAVSEDWDRTTKTYENQNEKQLYYFSMEFLTGRMLGQNLLSLGVYRMVEEALSELGYDLAELEELEPEPGLGNGGLGRLAACFMDSLATLGLPGHGCGIRYRGGLFTQSFQNGFQLEQPVEWITGADDWDVRREEDSVNIPFFGKVQTNEERGRLKPVIEEAEWVRAVPYDLPIVGAGGVVNTLRLWQAEESDRPLPAGKSRVAYQKETAELSDRLYPDDSQQAGKILRLKQQYFLCSASLQVILRQRNYPVEQLPEYVAIQINDTHPTLAIPELMRLLLDEHGLDWKQAWEITTSTISYTNHTILEEAMEKWDEQLIETLLPRIYMIIKEIDRRFKEGLKGQNLTEYERHKLAIIENGVIKMAVMAVVGSYKVNGVAALHTEILKKREMKELQAQFPAKFHNKTNGITHRRWLLKANPELADLITESIGASWLKEPERLGELNAFVNDRGFHEKFRAVKRMKKEQLVRYIEDEQYISIDPDSIFDVHIKRIHGYKRQLMNILHVYKLYDRIKSDFSYRPYPRTFFFGGKAAPGYKFAKQVIKLINTVAWKINNDPIAKSHLHVVFVEDYNVSHAERMIPAADLSEQISTASKEASGTGNMKFMMNGALTIGTVDGANVEIFERIGQENAFIFGLRAEEVMQYEKDGTYDPGDMIRSDPELAQLMEELQAGELSDGFDNADFIYRQLTDQGDPFFVLKDLGGYAAAHEQALAAYADERQWHRMAVKNIAESGFFSSDRTIRLYSEDVWKLGNIPHRAGK